MQQQNNMNPTLESLLDSIDQAHTAREEVTKTSIETKRNEYKHAHTEAVKTMTLGINWEIDEVREQI